MTIEILSEDVEFSEKGNATKCFLACAIKRVYPDKEVKVYGCLIKLGGLWISVNQSTRDLINKYDKQGKDTFSSQTFPFSLIISEEQNGLD